MLRRCLLGFAFLATLTGLYYAEENWRGKRAWENYRRQQEANGVRFDLAAYVPSAVPDGQNFAMTPFLAPMFDYEPGTQRRRDTNGFERLMKFDDVVRPVQIIGNQREKTDLTKWLAQYEWLTKFKQTQQWTPEKKFADALTNLPPGEIVTRVLAALKQFDPVLEEIRTASQRPYARFNVHYTEENPWGILLPHLSVVKRLCLMLSVRASAALATGQGGPAFRDLNLIFYLADSVKDEPFVISYLVRLACLQIAIQPAWEGLAEHRWSETQLQELQTRFQQYDFLTDMKRPLDSERAAGVLTADLLYRQKYRLSNLTGSYESGLNLSDWTFADLVGRIAPHGWYQQEQISYCRLYQMQLEGAFDPAKKQVSPGRIAANTHEFEREIASGRLGKGLNAVVHHQILAALLLPALNKIPLKAAVAQTAANQAALACALERHRLASGQFPEKLDALVPRFIAKLPHDVITGEPYKYRRADDGQFILHSVGWNEKDDDGMPGKTLWDEKLGDWVWRYPAKN